MKTDLNFKLLFYSLVLDNVGWRASQFLGAVLADSSHGTKEIPGLMNKFKNPYIQIQKIYSKNLNKNAQICEYFVDLVDARVVDLDEAAAHPLPRLHVLAGALARVLANIRYLSNTNINIDQKWELPIPISILTINGSYLTGAEPQHVLPLNNVQKANLSFGLLTLLNLPLLLPAPSPPWLAVPKNQILKS